MSDTAHRRRGGPVARLAGWSVHALTASGAVWALLALDATARMRVEAALWWMALAVVIDGLDGALARVVRVEEVLPWIDGALLDNLVDYLTYVIVPAFLLHRAVDLPEGSPILALAGIALAGAFQFTRRGAKTADRFVGFPSYWNVVVFYLLLFAPPAWVSLAIVSLFCVLSFVPLPWIYPTRTRAWRGTTLVLTIAWAASVGTLLWQMPDHPRWLAAASLGYGVYYVAASLWLLRR